MRHLSDETVAQLLEAGESYRCERKRNFSDKDGKDGKEKICRTICAFANDVSNTGELGLIALGIDDDGNACGLDISDALELEIQNIRGEGKIIPFPSFTTRQRQYRGQTILCIEVQPAISTPVKYDGRIWVRPGNSTQQAKVEDERRLNEKRRTKEQPDDALVLELFRVSDLNLEYFKNQYLAQAFARDVLQANGRTLEEQLASTKMIGWTLEPHPTVLGMLCLGFSPTDAVRGAYVQFLRMNGTELSDAVVDDAAIHGHVADVIAQTEAKFNAHNQIAIDFTSQDKERRTPQYPRAAFQQLFRNAVLHRAYLDTNAPIRVCWYSDRIEITNPGGPFGVVTQANFGKPGFTDYRNPNLAGVLKDLDYVQKFGAGISVARRALRDNGNPELEFETDTNLITAVLRQRP